MKKEWEALKTAGSRKNQSKFIEDMVVRDERTGRLALSCDKGSLEASVGLKHSSKTGWGDRALSKTLFKGKFGLTDEALRQAILDDEVQVKTSEGVAFCQWRELKDEHMDERATSAKLSLDSKKVTGHQAAQLAMLFESVSMERPDPSAEELSAASASIPSTFGNPQQATPALQAVEDQKPEEPAVLERLNPKEWEQAEGLFEKGRGGC